MNVLILEDEPLVAEETIGLVKKLRPGWTIHGPVPSARETRSWLQKNKVPELILADIQLSDGISIDMLAQLKVECPVIFITAFNQYDIRAFKINSIDYILKPIDTNELERAFQKFETQQSKLPSADLKALAAFLQENTDKIIYKENFLVTQGQHSQLVMQNDIAFFLKQELVFLTTMDGKQYVVDYRSLDEIEEIVDPKIFFRANRQYLAHRQIVRGFKSNSNGSLALTLKGSPQPVITVSREKASTFKRWIEHTV
jgi:two-component system LytT family response regulator